MGIMPLSGLLASDFWLGNQFYWIHHVGFALVLGGIVMVNWAHWIRKEEAKRTQQEYTQFHACPC